jgi:hypothetical protein
MGTKNAAVAQLDAIVGKGKKSRKKGKKGRKIGRYSKSPSCMRYKGERRWEGNKLRRMARHIRRFPADGQAISLLVALQ